MVSRLKFKYMTNENMHVLCSMHDLMPIRAFKHSTADGASPYYPNRSPILTCSKGAMLFVGDANTVWRVQCGAGVNVATFDWCLRAAGVRTIKQLNRMGFKLWEVEFCYDDIACVPRASTGKIRLNYCKVIREVKLKPKSLAPRRSRAQKPK